MEYFLSEKEHAFCQGTANQIRQLQAELNGALKCIAFREGFTGDVKFSDTLDRIYTEASEQGETNGSVTAMAEAGNSAIQVVNGAVR